MRLIKEGNEVISNTYAEKYKGEESQGRQKKGHCLLDTVQTGAQPCREGLKELKRREKPQCLEGAALGKANLKESSEWGDIAQTKQQRLLGTSGKQAIPCIEILRNKFAFCAKHISSLSLQYFPPSKDLSSMMVGGEGGKIQVALTENYQRIKKSPSG